MIYATPFDTNTKQCTGLSIDAMFPSLSHVVAAVGEHYILFTNRMVIYEGIAFSDFPFYLETLKRCPICNGLPCAYPNERFKGCLKCNE